MKKTIFIFLILFLFLSSFLFSQNLVNNPGFEVYSLCPDDSCQISYADQWYNASMDASYFNTCGVNGYGVPYNKYGYQQAASGDGYAEFCLKADFVTYIDNIGGHLFSPLIIGQKYFVSFKISLAGKSSAAYDRMGIGFSTHQGYAICGHAPWYEPEEKLHSDSIISDSINWNIISGSFVADSAYEYFTIGFMRVDTIHVIHFDMTSMPFALYFLDDVCVSTDSMTCLTTDIFESHSNNDFINIFPDPASENITIESPQNATITISNIQGQQIKTQTIAGIKTNIDVSSFPPGVYIVRVKTEKGIAVGKFVKE
jgi:hypothetical protein